MSFKAQARRIFGDPAVGPLENQGAAATRIAFVCTANICRSAYAHHGLDYLLNRDSRFQASAYAISSAGVLALTGEQMEDRMLTIFSEKYQGHQVQHVAQQLNDVYCRNQDLILVMTVGHRKKLLRDNPSVFSKTFLFSEFLNISDSLSDSDILDMGISNLVKKAHQMRGVGVVAEDIDDPYKRSENTYRRVCEEIDVLLARLVNILGKI